MNFEENKSKCMELMSKRDNIEQRIAFLTTYLTSPGPNGEPPAGINDSLVDKEGFPRADLDLYDIREKRHELNCLQHDYLDIMKQIELLLQRIYPSSDNKSNVVPNPPSLENMSISKKSNIEEDLQPFAGIDEIMKNSPAEKSGLKIGDKLLKFGSVTYKNHRNLQAIPDVVMNNLNNKVSVVVKREGIIDNMLLELVPQVWEGRGYLGCHLIPL